MELFKINGSLKKNQNGMIILKNKYPLKIIKILLLYIIIIYLKDYLFYNLKLIKNRTIKKNFIPSIKYYINTLLDNYIFFNVTYLKYSYSLKFNIAQIEYNITFYDGNDNIIFPSDLFLFNNFRIFCYIHITNTNYTINSFANIYNKYFTCIEFFNLNEIIFFGIKVYHNKETINYSNFCFNLENDFNYNHFIYENHNLFDPLLINDEYNFLANNINDKIINETLKLKKSYFQYPYCILKRNAVINNNKWIFKNIYNHHFCFCSGLHCLNSSVNEKCKFSFYLNIIDNNRNIYQKTDYLFIDFIFSDLSSDDVYPVFKEMEKQKFPVHYITEKLSLFEHYSKKCNNSLAILLVTNQKKPIDGDFLEKYLRIFLKLKIVVSGRGTTFNTNLFYDIEYISYICVGHGICYFKYFLYNEYRIYGNKKNDKILLPPSEKIISVAKKFGWKEKNIIKINLPRWDKYNDDKNKVFVSDIKEIIKNNSIFIMFTWRNILKNKQISSDYFKNIKKLLYNKILNKELKKSNIIIYLIFHRLIDKKYINSFFKKINKNKNIEFINQNEISECLKKTSLVVTDFSSIIFDLMYRRKPFVIYIPDANDPKIINIYKSEYYDLIKSMKNGTIMFENKYLNLDEAVNKIIYYINNNFTIEPKLEKFYDSFGLKNGNNINKFIDYLKFL